MRRLLAVAAVLLAASGWAVLAGAGNEDGDYRVDAIFDNAAFLIPGQDVRIAGATVGSVVDVRVTADRRARISMKIDPRYAPFRSDADCYIAPQSLIGERFIQCAPGTPRGRELRAAGDRPPTVPVENTHSPVDPDLVVETFSLPVRQRFGILLSELGAGMAGNGERLNAAIRRANPALQATDRVLRIVDRDRDVLGRLIDRSDVVLAELARRRGRVGAFIEEGARVSSSAARRTPAIEEGIARLPATLRETRASMDALRMLSDRSRPLLGDLREAAPPVERVLEQVPALSRAARPTLDRLGRMARIGERTLQDGAATVRRLRAFAALAVPAGRMVGDLTVNLRETGGVEHLQTFLRNTALALARFDEYSHILPAFPVGPAQCLRYAEAPLPGCEGRFEDETRAQARARSAKTAESAPRNRSLDYLLGP